MQATDSSKPRHMSLSADAVNAVGPVLKGREGMASTMVESLLGALKHGSQGDLSSTSPFHPHSSCLAVASITARHLYSAWALRQDQQDAFAGPVVLSLNSS